MIAGATIAAGPIALKLALAVFAIALLAILIPMVLPRRWW